MKLFGKEGSAVKEAGFGQVLLLVLVVLFSFPKLLNESELSTDVFTDHSGRLVTLPPSINKVYTTTESGLFLAYALSPDSILGWNRGLSPDLEFAVHHQYHDLPTLGTWDLSFYTIDLDTIAKLKPDLVIHYALINQENLSLAAKIESTLGIPTVVVDRSLQALPKALRFMGQLLGKELRGQALAIFVENQLAEIAAFQEYQGGFQPIPVHIVSPAVPGHFDELLGLAGMIEMPTWNNGLPLPDFVLIMPHSVMDSYQAIEKDGHKRLYQIPSFPLNWMEPGSIFSLLGLKWLHSIAYHTYTTDLTETYRAFMEVFFEINMTPELLAYTFKRSGISF